MENIENLMWGMKKPKSNWRMHCYICDKDYEGRFSLGYLRWEKKHEHLEIDPNMVDLYSSGWGRVPPRWLETLWYKFAYMFSDNEPSHKHII